ncbi:MAG: hypothetical protein SOT58_11685 [Agathobacter sp.]|nr:hypothetical protein [Agathobacter sp.]
MSILSKNELIDCLAVVLPNSRQLNIERINKQRVNTKAIYDLDRDNLEHNSYERRMLVYSTLMNEKIFMEYPGKETIRNNPMPKDTCPGLANSGGMVELDTSFGDIWDVVDNLGKSHKAYLPILAAVLIHMSCMCNYREVTSDRECWDINVADEGVKNYVESHARRATFYEIDFTKRVWETLNDMFSGICIRGQSMSFEAFIKYFDVLLMNEDSKYAYEAVSMEKATYDNWKYKKGRINTIGTCLNMIYYLEEKMTLSVLLDKYQKGRGTIPFSIPQFAGVSDGIITQE